MSESDPFPPSNESPAVTPVTPPLGYAAAAGGVPTYQGPPPDADARNMAMIAHLLNFTLIGPLIVYLVKKDTSPFAAHESREALNFSITCLIAHVAVAVLGPFLFCVSILLSVGLTLTQIILGIVAGLKAKEGVSYRYPLTLRLVS